MRLGGVGVSQHPHWMSIHHVYPRWKLPKAMLKERAAGERRAAGTCPKFSRDEGLSDLPLCADASHASLLPIRPGEREIAEKYRLERPLGRGGMDAV